MSSTDLESEIYKTRNKQKIDQIVSYLNQGTNTKLVEDLISQFQMGQEEQRVFLRSILDKASDSPDIARNAQRALDLMSNKMKVSALAVPSHCLMFVGLYFSSRDMSYSSLPFFTPNSNEEKIFLGRINAITNVFEYTAPAMCLLDFYARSEKYKEILRDATKYRNLTQNKKIMKSLLSSFKVDVKSNTKRVFSSLMMSDSKKLEMIQLTMSEVDSRKNPSVGILKKFNEFIESYNINKLYTKYAKDLSPEDLQILRAYFGDGNIKQLPENFFEILKKINVEMENEFLLGLSKGTDYNLLKKQLDVERNNSIKSIKPEKLNTMSKLCFAAVGTSAAIHGHIAALGPGKTRFDNIEDQWLRENRYNLAFASVAGIAPTCFGKIPLFIHERFRSKMVTHSLLDESDFRLLDNSLERANERFSNGERIKGNQRLKGADEALARAQSYLVSKNVLESAPNNLRSSSLIAFIDSISGGEKKIQTRILTDLETNDSKLLEELLNAKDSRYFESLLEYLKNGDERLASEFLKELDVNRLDLIKYLSILKKDYMKNPERLNKIENNLEKIKSEMKIKNIPFPDAKACLIALGTYIGTRDLLFSINNSYVDEDLDYLWEDVMFAADKLTGLGITYFCISDLFTHGKDISRYFAEVAGLKNSRANVDTLVEHLRVLRSDSKLQTKISRLSYIPSLNTLKVNALAQKISIRFSEGNNIDPKSKLPLLWQSYLRSNKVSKIFTKYSKSLSVSQSLELQKTLNSSSLSMNAKADKALTQVDLFYEEIAKEFRAWVVLNDDVASTEILKEIDELQIKQAQELQKLKKTNLGTNACFWGVGTILAGLGYHAAVGNKENKLDHTVEVVQREETDLLFKAAQALFLGTCGANVVFSQLAKNKKKAHIRNNLYLKNSKRDWEVLREVFTTEGPGAIRSSDDVNKIELKEFIRSIANKMPFYSTDTNIKKVRKPQKDLEVSIKQQITINKKFNFDADCLNKSLLKNLK